MTKTVGSQLSRSWYFHPYASFFSCHSLAQLDDSSQMRGVGDHLLSECMSSLREASVGDWVTGYFLGEAFQGLWSRLAVLVPNGELTAITSIFLMLELLTLGILTVLWGAHSNLRIMNVPHFSEEGCRPRGEVGASSVTFVMSALAYSSSRYLWAACSVPSSRKQWCPACPCPHRAHSTMGNKALINLQSNEKQKLLHCPVF